MGNKLTNKSTAAAEDFVKRVESLGNISRKKMFGGYGIFESRKMFALVNSSGDVFLKVGDTNRQKFEEAGSGPHGKMPYYQIPPDIIEEDKQLFAWTRESIEFSKGAAE
jgi:DNA transformation protein